MRRPSSYIAGATLALAVGLGPITALPSMAGGLFGDGPLTLQAGGFIAIAPEYEGSDEYRVIGLPFIAPAGDLGLLPKGFIDFRGPSDVRFRVLKYNGFELGPVAGYRFDREQDDGDLLRGLGDVDGGLILGAFASYGTGPFKAFASYQHQVTGDDTGAVVDFGAEARFKPSPILSLRTTVGAVWASEDYNQAYFGITAAQETTSLAGLVEEDVDAGIKDVYIGLNGDVLLSDRWTLKLNARYSRLVGDAGDSQVVEAEDQFFGGLGLTYKFTLDR
ncbi:MAG: MipA/OmpV family protein [Pseudomonadota bacterium]